MRDHAGEATRPADLSVCGAIFLLAAVLAWKVALVSTSPPPLLAHELLAPASTARGAAADSGRLVLVLGRGDGAAEAGLIRRAQRAHPRRTLDVERVPWEPQGDLRSRQGRIAALVRGYGHTELPVMLTVSRDGQVVRVQSLTP